MQFARLHLSLLCLWPFLSQLQSYIMWIGNSRGIKAPTTRQPLILSGTPPMREFLELPGLYTKEGQDPSLPVVRVQQFNVLADGLAALRPDLGKFSRLEKSMLDWEARKENLIREIVQYDADIITLQECDHYHDFFQPKLDALGYCGYFVSKPTSACLDVSKRSDGCALFVKRDRLRVTSCETKTLALSIAKLTDGGELEEPGLDSSSIQAQNQVAIIAVIEFVSLNSSRGAIGGGQFPPPEPRKWYQTDTGDANVQLPILLPPLLLATVHLKSSKSATGERYRQKGILQVLNDLARISHTLCRTGPPPAIILTGDFNAVPDEVSMQTFNSLYYGYKALTYQAVKYHSLGLRSVYNDDMPLSLTPRRSKDIYTTWKARSLKTVTDGGKNYLSESIVKRCIDYIFYLPYKKGPYRIYEDAASVPKNVAQSPSQIFVSLILRTTVWFFGLSTGFIAVVAEESLPAEQKVLIAFCSVLGLLIFELFSEGSIFRPFIDDVRFIEGIDSDAQFNKIEDDYLNPAGKAILASAERRNNITKTMKLWAKTAQSKAPWEYGYGNPGMRPVRVADLFSEDQVGSALLPNENYPSDHVSLVADLQLQW